VDPIPDYPEKRSIIAGFIFQALPESILEFTLVIPEVQYSD
jgi:hypothetical protein